MTLLTLSIIGIYLIGYIAAYYSIKLTNTHNDKRTWEDVKYDAKWSFLSWIVILIFIIFLLKDNIIDKICSIIKRKMPKTPPKWL